jgi:DNA-binding response OmpR family regulator
LAQQSKKESTIALIDDDPDVLDIFARFLLSPSRRILKGRSAEDCFRFFETGQVDLLILDLLMPEIDGFSILQALRANHAAARLPIIVATVLDDASTVRRLRWFKIHAHLVKPVRRRELQRAVETALEHRSGPN